MDVRTFDVVRFHPSRRDVFDYTEGFVKAVDGNRVRIAYTIPAFSTRPERHTARWFDLNQVDEVTARPALADLSA